MNIKWISSCHDQIDIYLMIFLCDSGRNTLTVVAAVRAAGTVSTTALHQEAAGPENDICPFQLFTQGYREITWRAAVELNFFPQKIEISSTSNASDVIISTQHFTKTYYFNINHFSSGSWTKFTFNS